VLAVLRADPVLGEEEGDNEAAQDELYDIGHGSDGERHSTRDPPEEDPGEHGEHVACLAVAVGVDATPAPTPRSTSPVHTCSSPSKDGQSSVSRFHFHARPGVEVLVEMPLQEISHLLTFDISHNTLKISHKLSFMTPS